MGEVNPYIVDSYEDYCELVYKIVLETGSLAHERLYARMQLDYVENILGFKTIGVAQTQELLKVILVKALGREPEQEDIKNASRVLGGRLNFVSCKDDDYMDKLCIACMTYERLLDDRKQADMQVINRDFNKILKNDKDLIIRYYRLLLLSSVNLIGSTTSDFKDLEKILTLDEQQKLDRNFREYLESLEDIEGLKCDRNKERILVVHPFTNGLHKIDGREFLFIEYFTFNGFIKNKFLETDKFHRIVDGVHTTDGGYYDYVD